jgi:hypothetical protein
MCARVVASPYAVCVVAVRTRSIAFIFATFLGFILPSLIGTILLVTISFPHFLYYLMMLGLLGFVNDVNFEQFGGELAVVAVIIGCNQSLWLVVRVIK